MKKIISPTIAEINLTAAARNMKAISRKAGKSRTIIAAVKSDAYGHGAVPVAKTLLRNGADMLGVALPEEAIELRKAGIRAPILNLFPVISTASRAIVSNSIRQSISTIEIAGALSKEASRQKKKVIVHVEVDTGMTRTGIDAEKAVGFVMKVATIKNLFLEGIWTHFANADTKNKRSVYKQLAVFKQIISTIEGNGITVPLKHAVNSAALLGVPGSYFNCVRPGLIVYGMYPSDNVKRSINVKPVLTLRSKITFMRSVRQGTGVSYGSTYVTRKKTVIATVPVGYGDGLNRALSNRGEVLIRGQRAPIIGIICMDQCMVNVGHIRGVKVGDEVVLIGRQKKKEITAEKIAQKLHTIPYEITCSLSKRVPRIYRK